MRAKFSYIDDCIKIGEGIFPVLVIENKKLYRGVLSSFLNSCEEDYFVFSEDFKPFEFSKDGCFISEPIFVDMNSRKLLCNNKANGLQVFGGVFFALGMLCKLFKIIGKVSQDESFCCRQYLSLLFAG